MLCHLSPIAGPLSRVRTGDEAIPFRGGQVPTPSGTQESGDLAIGARTCARTRARACAIGEALICGLMPRPVSGGLSHCQRQRVDHIFRLDGVVIGCVEVHTWCTPSRVSGARVSGAPCTRRADVRLIKGGVHLSVCMGYSYVATHYAQDLPLYWTYCLLLAAYCLLLTACCLLLTTYCLLLAMRSATQDPGPAVVLEYDTTAQYGRSNACA